MLKKFKDCVKRKIVLIAIGIAIALLAIIAVIAVIANKGEGTKKNTFTPDSELARAMTYGEFTDADADVSGTNYVKFSAFFLRDINNDGYAEKIKGTCKQIGKEDTLYMELNVLTNGYLENGVITINGNNFYLQTAIPKDNEIKDNVISNNTKQISLNQINNGTQKLLTGIVRSGDYSYDSQKFAAIGLDTTKMSGVNSIVLTGTHVAADGTRTAINKTIELNMDWYGNAKAEIPSYFLSNQNLNQIKDNTNVGDTENNKAVFEFEVAMQEVNNNILLSKACLEGTVPQLNGYNALNVESLDDNLVCTFDSEKSTFVATKTSELDESGTISKQCYDGTYNVSRGYIRYNKFKLRITYPLAAYIGSEDETVELKIPLKGHYEGYNNPNSEFENPYKSTKVNETLILTYSKPVGDLGLVRIYVGKYVWDPNTRYYVSKKKPLKIYNDISTEEKDDFYSVRWSISSGKQGKTDGYTLKETKDNEAQVVDQFIKLDSSLEPMTNVTTNVGIAFSNPVSLLGEDGWIKVYDDESGELIHEFTKDDWSRYSESNPYKYDHQINHVRVVTSATEPNSNLTVYNIKQLDDEYITSNYTKAQFDNFKYIKSTLVGYVGSSFLNSDTHSANYESPFSYARVELEKSAISTQETEKNMKIKINAQANEDANQEKWKNGAFLLKLPKDIVAIEINSVTSDTSSVTVSSYEAYEENGERFIKVITTNENPISFGLTIDCNITPDPRIPTTTEIIELYASNEDAVDYYNPVDDVYDVNGNLNTAEKVNKSSISINLISPNSLLTNQIASNYDENGSVAIAPQNAIVSKEKRSATVNIEINNNYSNTISNVQILGRVPFKGNKYAITKEDMGSTFTATMSNAGISLPDELKEIAIVYYSENGDATQDLTDASNGWTQNPSDYSKVKSYLVDLGGYKLAKGEKHTISYNINIPSGLNYNQVAYSHHGVYFCLDTDAGKYKTRTEPNKVGFMIAKQYDLELTKFQKGKKNIVSGATYAVYEDGKEDAKTRVTGVDGKLTLTGLYVDRTYVIKEIKSPNDYELNEEVVKFTTSESNGILVVTKNSGTVKNIKAIQPSGDNGYIVQIEVEDEVKARLKIKKLEKGTSTVIKGVGYKLTGAGLPTTGRNVTTNINGEINVKGLKVGQEYTLEETKAKGYYLTDPIKFKVTNSNGSYTVAVTSGTVKISNIKEEQNIPIINIELEDEKIPTYDLEISKIKRVTSVTEGESGTQQEATTYLQGAKFKLYKDGKEIGTYVTDSNGKITISGLYQYIDGKDEEALYLLKETLAPDGYSKVKDITFKVDGSTGELKFINTEGKEENYTVNGNKVTLTIEDSPSFKLIKKDAETGAKLAGIKFAIYNVEEGTTPAKNSKGEILGTKEIINGKEYYTVTTDKNGELTADLTEGMYKAVEVQAPDKYDISEPYYFGIGRSREGKERVKATEAHAIGLGNDYIYTVSGTSDGGYIVGGKFHYENIDLGNGVSLKNTFTGNYDGMVIKYSKTGEAEWANGVGGASAGEVVNIVLELEDGGYLAGGYFESGTINLGNDVLLRNNSSNYTKDGMIIKYNSNGETEWAKAIGGTRDDQITTISKTSDGGYIVGGDFASPSVDFENGISIINRSYTADGMIIKYSGNGEVEWAKELGTECVLSIAETGDGGYLAGGSFLSGTVDLGNEIILTNHSSFRDGMIIKCSENGEVEWAKAIGGTESDSVNSVLTCNDGSYLVCGSFCSKSIDLGNGIILDGKNYYSTDNDGMMIKYSINGEVEWAKSLGGGSQERIKSVALTSDGGYIVGGYFNTLSLDLGNDVFLSAKDYEDGMVIKYNSSGEAEWAYEIGDKGSDYIYSVAETIDGNYVVGGYFGSDNIDLENGVSLAPKGGMIVKLEKLEASTLSVVQAKAFGETEKDRITTVAETSDGGYIVGGDFESDSIDLGNGVILTNKGSADGIIIKYNSFGEIEWTQVIGGTNYDYITSIIETSDGGYLVGGYFGSGIIDLGNGITLRYKRYSDGMLIKYNSKGIVEWAQGIGGTNYDYINSIAETKDGGYIVGGYFKSATIDLGSGVTLTHSLGSSTDYDGIVIKYSSMGDVEWAHVIGGDNDDSINTVAKTNDGGCLVGGYFESSSIVLENGKILNNEGSSDGILLKYNSNGEIDWIKRIGGTRIEKITSVTETSDGDYIVVGSFNSTHIDLEDGISLDHNNYSSGDDDGMIIKYGGNGKIKWARRIGESGTMAITTVSETSDGGYIVGGYFYLKSIYFGNGISIGNKGSNAVADGMVIKYNSEGTAEWAKGIGGATGDYIEAVAEINDGSYVAGGYFGSSSIDLDNGKTLINNGNFDGMILKITPQMGVPEVQELQVENKRKEFKITTDVNEIDGIKGGSISGEDRSPYESVKYGDSSTKEIKMIPDENYEIIGITVNGEEYKFTKNADGSYTMPQFTNMIEDKHIVVTYSLKDNKITINKVDKKTKAKLTGAKFNLDQVEERIEPNNASIIGSLTDNGQVYTKTTITTEVSGKIETLINNGTYYFVQNSDGTYTPTNSKTYQTANGGTAGIRSATANSYVLIDLTGLTGTYGVVVNASCSSEGSDYGYATITETTSAPSYSSTTGRFMYVSGTNSSKDYTSAVLDGGKKYYLHLGYYKDGSIDTGADQVVINSIKLYNATGETKIYNFINNNGKYESTNVGEDNTVANSYIPIDLTNYTGKYNLMVNAEVSSQSSDYGYATVTENTTRPSYSSSIGQFIYISGTKEAKDYSTVLQGGKMYYLHFGYYKNASLSSGDDKFTVNSVKVTLNDSELYHVTVETNSDGQAITQIPFGKYKITEIQAPDGYLINETPTIVEFRSTDGAVHEFTIEDEAKAKLVVRHYIKGTTTKLVDDEDYEDKIGEKYVTNPKLDLTKYELEKDSNGNYILPANAVGTYKDGVIEVTYYYVQKQIPLTVHHYIEGTTTKVPLKSGGTADDVTGSGTEGEKYTTSAVADSLLSDEYELVETPSNANGTYSGNEVIVTYYYKKVSRDVNLVKYKEDGTTPLEGAKFRINGKDYVTDANGRINVKLEAGSYDITEIEAPDGYKLPTNPTTQITITKATPETIKITNTKKTGTVTVHHYIEGTTTRVPLVKGGTADDETKTGNVGDMYATKARTDISNAYELISEPANASGNYIDGNIEVIYYYRSIATSVLVHHYLEGTTTKLADDVTIDGIVGNDYTTNVANVDSKYELVSTPANASGKMTKAQIVVIYYYRVKDTSVLVHHYIEGTTTSLSADVTIKGKVDESYSTTKASDIASKYELVSTPANASGKMTVAQTVVIYYYRLKDTSVLVHHYLEGTTTKLANDVTIKGKVDDEYKTVVATDLINGKYDLVAEPSNKNGTMTEAQIVVIYYYRLKDTSVLVHHYIKGTTTSLSNDVMIKGKIDDKYTTLKASDIPEQYELVETPANASGTMTKSQIVVIYYYQLKNYSYTVNYLEKDTNKTLHDTKQGGNLVYGSKVNASDEVIDIDGYNYDSVDKDVLTIGTKNNVINVYYTKRTDLSYKVNYLEKSTNKVLHDQKNKGNMTFESVVKSSDEVIDIDGYDYDSVDKDTLTISTGENVINIYYTKRRNLSYKVNYLEKGTNKVLHDQKNKSGMIFWTVIKSSDEVIDIDGYNYDSVDKDTMTIGTGENVINIYYTKRTDLSYKVNYLEKGTNTVLHKQKTQDGMTFESVVNTSDEIISIYGYNYDSADKDTLTIGIGENVINIYYMKKDTKVIVHYYEEGTTNKVSDDVEIPGKVFDDYTTESASDVPSKYELVAEPENKNGTMTEDEITVIYYYRKKETKVIVHYYEENTTKKLSEDVTINGRVDDPYSTVSADDIPIKYELVVEPVNKMGSMTETTIEVIYYYRVKDAVVHVRYLEKGTDIVLADPDRIDGKVDEDYQTTPKEIDGYQLVEHTGNEKGKFEVEPLTITYYYLYKTKATVQYIDKITGEILEESTTEGLEGDDFVTESKDFENYILDEEPPEKVVKMTKEEQILKYYYVHISGGVIEKHIDIISNEILANAAYEGNEGDDYDIPSRTFEGYDLVEDKLPTNSNGKMKIEPIEVIYYYIYRTKVTAEYIDKNTGEKLTEDVVQDGHEGDKYETERKNFEDYKLVEVPANADGDMTKDEITVTYYYVHVSGGVIVNHIDIKTGKQLIDEAKEEGYEGDPYETHEENIPEYDLVKEKYPENAKGKMTIDPTRVTYYYIKITEVNVKYVDKETGEEIEEPTNIPGHEGDDYTTEPKDVPGYDLIEEPENKDGTMTADPIDVIYYYKRPAKVIVNYYDIDTDEKIAREVEIDGHQNDEYTTEEKDIQYYKIEKVPENKDGKMEVTVTKDEDGNEVVNDITYVNYYYRKLVFNLKVDKIVKKAIVNDQEIAINGVLGKVEVYRNSIQTSNVKIIYNIRVTNDSELSGKANIVEKIPDGMAMLTEDNPDWKIKGLTATLKTGDIKPGESKDYEVVMTWRNEEANVGTKENMVTITTENEAGFNEQFETDNVSKATMIVAVATGESSYIRIANDVLFISLGILAIVWAIDSKRREP